MSTPATVRLRVRVVPAAWVRPYLLLMSRMPGGPVATAAVARFVADRGLSVVAR